MLLRASSQALGAEVDTGAVLGDATDSGVEHGAVLEAYAAAAHDGDGLVDAGAAVRDAVGGAGWVEAAMTVAAFNGLVRTADASGIPLDDGVVSATATDRGELGLDSFGGAANSDLAIAGGATPHPDLFNQPG
jgi:hypothetical protein